MRYTTRKDGTEVVRVGSCRICVRATKLRTLSLDNGESINDSIPPQHTLILQVAYGYWVGYRKAKEDNINQHKPITDLTT